MTTPHIKTPLPGPNAKAIIDRDKMVVSPSYTRGYPLVIASGSGSSVEDVDGNVFLDCAAGIAVNSTGHSHPDVVKAIVEQAQKFLHMSGTDFYYEPQVKLAEELASIAPIQGGVRSFFGNSGTEAVEACLKLSRYATGRHNIIAFYGGFHGRTMGALSLTASKAVQRRGFGPLLPGVHHIPYAYCYRCAYGKTPDTCAVECATVIETQLVKTIAPADEVAAIVLEPVQGEGGYIVPPPKFIEELERIARKFGMLLIFDEVQSGMGRTGRMWAADHFGAVPDIFTVAKGIASGMPLGATVARAEIMTWPPGSQGTTFGGNPVSVAAALATIELLERELVENARRIGEHMMGRMKCWPQRFAHVGDVRGLGLMLAFELVQDKETREPFPQLRNSVVERAFERGVLILGAGASSIRLSPPLVINRDQADFALGVLEE